MNLNKPDNSGVNAFWMACFMGNVELMRILFDRNVMLHTVNKNGSNALHIAVKKAHE